ncbi:hypothetical protein SLV14_002022 [Streptomyces sp. Je 1-4]|uniref:hypothetical protein n=1 Tax=Streptomyces TaxID=1883 RepID=UPI0021D80AE7|nr:MULTISPECIES: hypothetical protein [unclassified Streptomyces]UYB39516.1 hypothetical protein SLV14_002022 [Streptomyces sp. Je 1-4]UZQ35553.1 hypothetical protein SLV14N_002022 [Streptomyces sp. Je 1-4] [Streptomyces sp. Je 1-4 4N24]UZQ42971.1 hypothetical protein SLV14NA_002022 [Streptomyces sp. Je 1-4] [Streptomyces sp. Je 1-4 4N24_ara]
MDEETETDTKKKERRIDLSVAQVAGSALAAAVAAYLAGRLGIYGTIIGAGLVSVVATTGGSIFQHLFRRTGEQLKEATVTTRPKPRRSSSTRTRSTTPHARPAEPTMVLPTFDKQGTEDKVTSVAARTPGRDTARTQLIPRAEQARRRDPASAHPAPQSDDATRILRAAGQGAIGAPRTADGAGRGRPADRTQLVPRLDERSMTPARPTGPPARQPAGPPEELGTTTYGTRLRGWKRPALGALAVFVLAMGVVTGTELVTGQTPSGEKGTTLSRLTHTGGGGGQQPGSPQSPDPGSPEHGKRHGNGGEPSPDPGTSEDPGTDKKKDGDAPSPAPSPSDGDKTSPDPGTPSSPDPSPSESTGDGGAGNDDGSTGGEDQGDRQHQQESDAQDPAPGAS